MVKLKRLKILKYRNVRPGTELRFDDGFNLVLGKNGSGKTTLLGLIAMACGWNFSTLEDEEFSLEFNLVEDQREWHCCIENEQDLFDPDTLWYEYRITGLFPDIPSATIAGDPSANYVILPHGPEYHYNPLSPFAPRFLDRLVSSLPGDEETPTFTPSIWLAPHEPLPARFDEALGYFYGLTGQPAPPTGACGLSTIKTVIRRTIDGDGPQIRFRDHNPHRIATAVLAEIVPPRTANPDPPLSLPARSIAWLARFVEIAGFADGFLLVDFSSYTRNDLEITGLSFFLQQFGGTTLQHDRLSYGQKRMLAFHYYLANADRFVIADELVNGLHHRWIEACMEAIGDRQAFLTSQNPLLFDYIPDFESAEQVKARFITCRTETVDGAEQLVWDNLSDEQAEVFFAAYRREVQPVGEILITRGLW